MKNYKVYIDPASDILYGSYYILGLKKMFGKIRFSNKYFSGLTHNNVYFPFVIKTPERIYKVAIDFGDSYKVNETALDWCDAYGKININDEKSLHLDNPKIVSIGPGFAVRIYSKLKTIRLALLNYMRAASRIPNKRRFFADYYGQYKRQALSYYAPVEAIENYIFFAGALWKGESDTNQLRANYIRACKRAQGVQFEGGFAPRSKNDIEGFDDITMETSVEMSAYLMKIKQSATVFNVPVILDCHGWKLGEFMAMGKAIIATPIKNRLPVPLEHGKNVHFVSGDEDDMLKAVTKLTTDAEYRKKLERNIHDYFKEHVTPTKSLIRVFEQLKGFKL